jgi:hypothetical protein
VVTPRLPQGSGIFRATRQDPKNPLALVFDLLTLPFQLTGQVADMPFSLPVPLTTAGTRWYNLLLPNGTNYRVIAFPFQGVAYALPTPEDIEIVLQRYSPVGDPLEQLPTWYQVIFGLPPI